MLVSNWFVWRFSQLPPIIENNQLQTLNQFQRILYEREVFKMFAFETDEWQEYIGNNTIELTDLMRQRLSEKSLSQMSEEEKKKISTNWFY